MSKRLGEYLSTSGISHQTAKQCRPGATKQTLLTTVPGAVIVYAQAACLLSGGRWGFSATFFSSMQNNLKKFEAKMKIFELSLSLSLSPRLLLFG